MSSRTFRRLERSIRRAISHFSPREYSALDYPALFQLAASVQPNTRSIIHRTSTAGLTPEEERERESRSFVLRFQAAV